MLPSEGINALGFIPRPKQSQNSRDVIQAASTRPRILTSPRFSTSDFGDRHVEFSDWPVGDWYGANQGAGG